MEFPQSDGEGDWRIAYCLQPGNTVESPLGLYGGHCVKFKTRASAEEYIVGLNKYLDDEREGSQIYWPVHISELYHEGEL